MDDPTDDLFAHYRRQQAASKFVLDTLIEAKKRIIAEITILSDGDLKSGVSYEMARQILAEVNRAIDKAEKEYSRFLTGAFGDFAVRGYSAAASMMATFAAQYPSGFNSRTLRRFSAMSPRVNTDLLKITQETALQLLSQDARNLVPKIKKALGVNILTGGSRYDLINEIAGTGLRPGIFKSVEQRANAIAVTETTSIYNTAAMQAIEDANQSIPDNNKIQMQWRALLDKKTSSICRALNGELREAGGFVCRTTKGGNGKKYDKPPAHPHCRSMIVPWKADWQGIIDDMESKLKA